MDRQKRIENQAERWKKIGPGTIKGILKTEYLKLRRMETADDYGYCECVTCGSRKKWNSGKIHGGHFIHSTSPAMLVPENVNPQCSACNTYNRGGRVAASYREWMEKTHGQKVIDELQRLDNSGRTYTTEEMAEMIIDIRILTEIEKRRLAV